VKQPSVFTIAPSAPFAQTLARGLIARVGDDPLTLSSAIIYLPTRRAARSLADAFAQVKGGSILLPQFRPLGDAEEDDLLFDAADADLELLPVIDRHRRQFLLAQLIRRWDREGRGGMLSFAQCAALADSLAEVMDEVERHGADLGKLKEMLPGEMAEHWEGVTRFLDILSTSWPPVLKDEKRSTPEARRAQTLKSRAEQLKASPPDSWVIAAGSTGSRPATAELLRVIARLPQGAVVLPGLDQRLDSESWAELEDAPGHPQFGLHELLKTIGAERNDVKDWFAAPANTARETLLTEVLRPAPTTDAWRELVQSGTGKIREGLNGIALIQAADPAQEALSIALALRETLETPGRTAALVTPDRNLARRVAAEMARWNVSIDDSAGRPLAHASAGTFLCLLAEAAQAHFAPVPLLALLKHPFARGGQDAAVFRARARELDRWCLRGPRPDPGLAGIANAIAKASGARRPPPAEGLAQLAAWWKDLAGLLGPLEEIFAERQVPLGALLEIHLAAAKALARDANSDCLLWTGSEGETASQLVAALAGAAENLDPIEPHAWPPLFRQLAMKTPVRKAFGRHPRLAILGPLEARLQRFDRIVLGGLNEGTWPQSAGADPWFSRPMRASLGLEQPERSIGLSAHDFAMLAAGPDVLLSRSLKADGAPTIASRWLQRLEQLTRGLGLADALTPAQDYAKLAARLLDIPQGQRLARPAPTPPVATRPRRLSVTEIETWLRDPYAIYAKHVLGLRPLDALDEPIGPLERGTALHKALELFIDKYQGGLPDDAERQLTAIADQVFADAGIPKAALALWRPRFAGAARGFIAVERERRGAIAQTFLETHGMRKFPAPGGDFTLSGQADRIDILKDGSAAIVDYKTGAIPSGPQVQELLAPQLPLEGAILSEGGFGGIGKKIAEELIYLSLANEEKAGKPVYIRDAAALAQRAAEKLAQRIAWFDQPQTPYLSRVRPYRADIAGDYDHLARVREWSPSGWAQEE